jgi:thymidylate synthase (FAD)
MPANVKLINVTPDAEKTILYIARVSSDQTNDDRGLLKYLIRNGHWSPFMHAFMTLEVKTSRAIGMQIIRHWTLTCTEQDDVPGVQEFSQRYAAAVEWIEYPARAKGATNRQSSIDSLLPYERDWWAEAQKEVADLAFEKYQKALEMGIAPECARMLLPMSTQTVIYLSGSLRSWIHYLGDGPGGRTNEHTQLEHRELAEEGKAIFCKQFPVISAALEWS